MKKNKVRTNYQRENLEEKVFNKALFFLKFRPRSTKEVRENLLKFLQNKKIPTEEQNKLIEETISRLSKLKYLDDRDFIRFWVERRFQDNPKGDRIIYLELKQKGIPEELISEQLPEELKKFSKEEVIKKLLEKADKRYQHFPYLLRKQKFFNFFLRRGFPYSEVGRVVDEFLKKK